MSNIYHINSKGVLAVCRAKIKCPLGGVTEHYNNLSEGMKILDELNEQLSNKDGFGIAVASNGHKMFDKRTQSTVIQLQNIKMTMEKLENIKKAARKEILSEMLRIGSPVTISDTVGKISYVSGSTSTVVDTDALRDAGLYDAYLKDSNVSEHLKLDREKTERDLRILKNIQTPTGKVIDFGLYVKDDASLGVTDAGRESIKALREYEQKLKEITELEKELRKGLLEEMKEKGIDKIEVGKASLEYVPEFTRQIVNTEALRTDGIYGEYSKEVVKEPSIRITYSKTA